MLNHIGGKHNILQQILEEERAAGAKATNQSESGDGPSGGMKALQESRGQVEVMEVHDDMESHREEEHGNKEGVEGGKSVANIQVRLTDGTRLIVKLNHE